MRFASLGSGSKGNATLVDGGDGLLLIDCGFSRRELARRLERLGHCLDEIRAILVTHEHGDHVGGVEALARHLDIDVFATVGTARAAPQLAALRLHAINLHRDFDVAGVTVTPVAVPHDAREAAQFVLRRSGRALGVLTDLGSITPHVVDSYRGCDALLLECNHDRDMLFDGPYPPSLKQRVGSDWGHLSNAQAADLLAGLEVERLQRLVLAHVSETNNTADLAWQAIAPVMRDESRMTLADQERGFDWIALQ